MNQQPGPLTKIFAVIGFIWLLWIALSLLTDIPGPLELNQ